MNSMLKRVAVAAFAPLLLLALSACAPTVALTPAADATNADCANVIVHLPQSVAGKAIRQTDAQATSAWGDPAAIILRCGVTPPGPTTDICYTVKGIDWVIDSSKQPVYTFTTYGRDPAVQVVVDSTLTSGQGTIVLDELANPVSFIAQSKTHKCENVLAPSTPTPTPAPTPTPTP
ncbi:MAG: hypothetical protein QOG18_102 [Microbacteriaceae bacterium]|jgi:hypothetical protein|nr:hypothetical protein [Microbacteriaceae bacterium]MDQ1525489.1 hypothetical protein [Microbacteriaceae bacterium]